VVHQGLSIEGCNRGGMRGHNREAVAARPTSQSEVKDAPAAGRRQKKGTSISTRLPTKIVWQLLCWIFILATADRPETRANAGFSRVAGRQRRKISTVFQQAWVRGLGTVTAPSTRSLTALDRRTNSF
jgi:hypothetical protein